MTLENTDGYFLRDVTLSLTAVIPETVDTVITQIIVTGALVCTRMPQFVDAHRTAAATPP